MVNTWHCPLDGSELSLWPYTGGISLNASAMAGCSNSHRWMVLGIDDGKRLVFAEQAGDDAGKRHLLEALKKA